MSSPLISVALSVYNGARYLSEQLDSVLSQRDVTLEVIAVDDGSTDDSVALLHDYARRDRRVEVHVNPSNLGPTRSFERAMSLGHGELIAPCDQDDRWHPDKLATLLGALGGADLAYCDSEYIDADGRPSGRRISDKRTMLYGRHPLPFVFANSVSGHAMLLRRRVFERAQPLPPELYHDWVLAMLAAAGNGVVYVDVPLVQYRRHAQAFSPMDNAHSAAPQGRSGQWLRERSQLLKVLADRGEDTSGSVRRLADALAFAIAGQRMPLLRCVWRERAELAGGRGAPALRACKLQLKLLRKLRAASSEADPTLARDQRA